MYFLTLLLALPSFGQEPVDFSLVEEGKTIDGSAPVGSVDEKGEVKWIYPPGYFEKKERAMKEALKKKSAAETEAEKRRLQEQMKLKMDSLKARTIASEKKEPDFKLASNEGKQIKGTAHILGYYYGANLSLLWRKGHWSYGIMGKYAASSNADTGSKESLVGVLGQGQYHLFPRWYTDSSSHKVLDPFITFAGGYMTSSSEGGLGLTTGLGASYPLSKGFKAYGEYEIMMFKNMDGVHGSYSLGLSWEF